MCIHYIIETTNTLELLLNSVPPAVGPYYL